MSNTVQVHYFKSPIKLVRQIPITIIHWLIVPAFIKPTFFSFVLNVFFFYLSRITASQKEFVPCTCVRSVLCQSTAV